MVSLRETVMLSPFHIQTCQGYIKISGRRSLQLGSALSIILIGARPPSLPELGGTILTDWIIFLKLRLAGNGRIMHQWSLHSNRKNEVSEA